MSIVRATGSNLEPLLNNIINRITSAMKLSPTTPDGTINRLILHSFLGKFRCHNKLTNVSTNQQCQLANCLNVS